MKSIVLDTIPFKPYLTYLYKHLHVPDGPKERQTFDDLAAEAARIAQPKALCGLAAIEKRGEDFIIVENRRFESRVLAVNVNELNRVFPFVVTCGQELVE